MSEETLKRIAAALEDIASMMRGKPARQASVVDVRRDELVALMRENAGKLVGKMDMQEVALALGIMMDPTKRREMGAALKAYGAVRGMSNNKGYYLFPGTERQAIQQSKAPDRVVLRMEAFRAAMIKKRPAFSGPMTARQVITELGFKRMPGDEASLVAALEAEDIQHTIENDIFIFEVD